MTASYTVTPGSSAVQLSTAILTSTPAAPLGAQPISGRFVSFQADAANTGILYFGGNNQGSGTASTAFGFRIEIPVTSIPSAPVVFEVPNGNIALDEFWVKASVNTDKLHIFIKD